MSEPARGGASRSARLLRAVVLRPEAGAAVGAIGVTVLFWFLSPYFLTVETFSGVTTVAAELAIFSAGATMLMIGGEFDLSIGSVMGFCAYFYPFLVVNGIGTVPAIVLTLGVAVLAGLLNAFAVVRLRLSSFIVTLASMLFWRGVLLAISGGFPIPVLSGGTAGQILSGYLPSRYPVSLIWLAFIVIVLTIVLLRTRWGNWIFATGGNRTVARNLGVPVDRVKVGLFVLSSFLAAFMGIIQVGRFGSVDALRGQGLELQAIITSVIGGTLLAGGYGSVIGTVLGALIFGEVQSGLVIAGAPPYYFQAFLGVVFMVAVLINLRVRELAASSR